MPTKQKEQQIELLKEKFAKANSVIIADHTGINVADLTVLRRDLRKADAEFKIAKNTLLKLASKDKGIKGLDDNFVGPTAMIFGFDDPSAPAKIIYEFAKKTEIPKVKAYILDDQLLTGADFKKIAQLPSKEEVLATLIGSLDGVISQFILTLDGATRKFIGLLDALAEKNK